MRKLHIVLPTAVLASLALAALALPASAAVATGTPRHERAHVKTLVAPTKTSTLHIERLTVPGAARAKPNTIAGGGGTCATSEETTFTKNTYPHGTLVGKAWTSDCTGASSCHQLATLQIYDIKDPALGWSNVDSGVTTTGCSFAHRSVASASCTSTTTPWDYRTRGIFTVLWDNGSMSGPVDLYSGAQGDNYAC
jgi:hypothetical protein